MIDELQRLYEAVQTVGLRKFLLGLYYLFLIVLTWRLHDFAEWLSDRCRRDELDIDCRISAAG